MQGMAADEAFTSASIRPDDLIADFLHLTLKVGLRSGD